MINYGSYKPTINRSPSERPYGGSNLLKQQYQNSSKQNISTQFEDESNSENPFSGEIKFSLAEPNYNNLNNNVKINATDMGKNNGSVARSSSNFWNKKYTPGGKIEPEGIDKFRQQQKTNTLTPQTPSLDKFRQQQQTNTIVASTPRLDAFREQQKKR